MLVKSILGQIHEYMCQLLSTLQSQMKVQFGGVKIVIEPHKGSGLLFSDTVNYNTVQSLSNVSVILLPFPF